jgi:phosphoesterase RecJ-like protein
MAGDNGAASSQMVWTSLTLADRQAADYSGNDDADLINQLSSIDCDVAIIFVEQKQGRTKVSWRSRPGIDVSQIALQFGGGGHAAAAGADINGTLDEVQEQVLKATRASLKQVLAGKPRAAEQTAAPAPVPGQGAQATGQEP